MFQLPNDPISRARSAVAHFDTSIRIYRPKLQLEVESCFQYTAEGAELDRRIVEEPNGVRAEFGYLVEASYEVDVYDRASFISASASFLIIDEVLTDLAARFDVKGGLSADFGRVAVSKTRTLSLPTIATACTNMLRHILEWEKLHFEVAERRYVAPAENDTKRLFDKQMASINVIRESMSTEFPVARHDASMLLDILCSDSETHERSYVLLEKRLFQCCAELAVRAGMSIGELTPRGSAE